jgi:hypothetical protein
MRVSIVVSTSENPSLSPLPLMNSRSRCTSAIPTASTRATDGPETNRSYNSGRKSVSSFLNTAEIVTSDSIERVEQYTLLTMSTYRYMSGFRSTSVRQWNHPAFVLQFHFHRERGEFMLDWYRWTDVTRSKVDFGASHVTSSRWYREHAFV